MKRIFSLILAFCMLPIVYSTVSAEGEKSITQYQSEAHSAMTMLGYLDESYSVDRLLEEDSILRAEFAELIHTVFYGENARSTNLYFADVPKLHYAVNPISVLVERGVISVGADKKFYPERYITAIEAAKMIEYALGLEPVCEVMGGYPSGVLAVAQETELFKGINTGENLTFFDAIVMIYNSLDVDLPEITIDGATLNRGDETFLSKYYDIYSGKGVLNAYNGVSAYGDTVAEGETVIGDISFEGSEVDAFSYLGREVKYFYREDDGVYTLLWIWGTDKGEEITLNYIENSVSFNEKDYSFEYVIDGKTKKVDISKNISVVYNGEYLKDNIEATLSGEWYELRLVAGKNKDYDIAVINAYENYEVVGIDKTKEILYLKPCDTKNTKNKQINIGDYENVIIELADKSIGNIESLTVNSILSVSEAKDTVKIMISSESVSGTVEGITQDGDYEVIKISGEEYKVYKKNLSLDVKTGSKEKLILDVYGYAAAKGYETENVKFAYIIKPYIDEDKDSVNLKMFDSSGDIITLLVSDKVKIDSMRTKDINDTYNKLNGAKEELIAYSANSSGEIYEIDIAEENKAVAPKDMLVKNHDFKSLVYSQPTGKLGSKIRIGAKTILMSVPGNLENSDEWEKFAIGSRDNLSHEISYNVAVYTYGEVKEFSDVVLIKNTTLGGEYFVSTRVLVKDVSKVFQNDAIYYKISGYHGSTARELLCDIDVLEEKAPNLKAGDAIWVNGYANGKIDDFDLKYGPDGTYNQNLNYAATGARDTWFYAHDVIGTTVFGGFSSGETWDEIFTPANQTVMVYNSDTKTIEPGSIADIKTYKATQDINECSKIYVYLNGGGVRNFVVYN